MSVIVVLKYSRKCYNLYQLHAVPRKQQGRQWEPNVKIVVCTLFSAEFWRHCELSGGTQHHALPQHQNEEMKI